MVQYRTVKLKVCESVSTACLYVLCCVVEPAQATTTQRTYYCFASQLDIKSEELEKEPESSTSLFYSQVL